MSQNLATFDRAAAISRSLLGWGVVAGPFYVLVGFVLALTRPGFDITRHALSLLTLGEHGWIQRANFVLSALMVIAAAYGILRAIRSGRGLAIGTLTGAYGLCLVLSGIFLPDPASGFPPGQTVGIPTTGGILHLLFGGIGFVCFSAAAFAYAKWASVRGEAGQSWLGILCGAVTLIGFVCGAVLAQSPIGVGLLWLSVLAGWLWLALACAHLYTVVPHPVIAARNKPQEI